MKENSRDEEQKFPRTVSRMAKRTASTLWFVNSMFCEAKYEREKNYKESGIFPSEKPHLLAQCICACVYAQQYHPSS